MPIEILETKSAPDVIIAIIVHVNMTLLSVWPGVYSVYCDMLVRAPLLSSVAHGSHVYSVYCSACV